MHFHLMVFSFLFTIYSKLSLSFERGFQNKKAKLKNLKLAYIFSQADLDDGHCPTWTNQLRALYHMWQFVHEHLNGTVQLC